VTGLLAVAVALGLSNFAAAIGIGIGGIDARRRLRVAIAFGVFEAGMPLLGLLLGHGLSARLGDAGRYLGAILHAATGLYALIQARSGPAVLALSPRRAGDVREVLESLAT
jgi:putative Mn2+ efflux pump MntP